ISSESSFLPKLFASLSVLSVIWMVIGIPMWEFANEECHLHICERAVFKPHSEFKCEAEQRSHRVELKQ
ncbi:hypothetical protein SJAG_06614, partial [Schizosaccharomyces japonicus yFS275]